MAASPASPSEAFAAGLVARLRRRFARAIADSGLPRLDLRWRFRCVVLAFGMPFCVYMVWSAAHEAAMEKTAVRGLAQADAMLLGARFEDHIEQIDRLLGTAAESVAPRIHDPAALNPLVQSLRSFVPKGIDNIAVWGLDGNIVASLDRRSSQRAVNVADRRYFTDALARRQLAFEGPTTSRSTGARIIQFAHPVFGPDSEPVGVISMSLRPSDLIALLDPSGRISDRALVTVYDDGGRVVARSVDAALWADRPVHDRASLAAAFADRDGSREGIDSDGERRLTGYAVVGHWPWMVEVGQPIENVVGPASAALLTHLAIGLVIFAIALVLAGRVAETIVAPLMRLAADTERLGHGDLSHRSVVASGGEVAILADNINRMATLIEERERALAASRAQLHAITDNMPAQIHYLDRDERYRFVNDHRSAGIPAIASGMIGRSVRDVLGDPMHAVLAPHMRLAMEGHATHVEVSRTDDDGTHHLHYAYVPDRADDGTVLGIYAFAQDITERKNAELSQAESEKRLATITDNLPAMICYVDDERRFRFANRAFEKWLQRPVSEIIGQPFDRLVKPSLAAQYDYHFLHSLHGETLEFEVETESRSGEPIWLRCVFIPDVDATGRVRGVYGMLNNVTRAKHAEQRLTRLAKFDTLTGLANRHQFNETLAGAIAENDRLRAPLALMFLDIDHFKQVNDRHGHGGGDLLLKEFSTRLTQCVRPGDTVARLSGDEFVVLLEGLHSDEEPQFVARKIIAAVDKPFQLDDGTAFVTTSIGIAVRDGAGESASLLMRRADEALYEAKRSGRNTFRLAS